MTYLTAILHLFIGATLGGVLIVAALVAGVGSGWVLFGAVVVGMGVGWPLSAWVARILIEGDGKR